MNEKIIEIIIFVISELRSNKNISEIDIDGLIDLGYTDSEISTALSWLVDRTEFADNKDYSRAATRASSFRVLHTAESDMFTKDAWGEMIQLSSLGILTNDNIESLIERAAITGINKIDSEQLKSFVANAVFNVQMQDFPGSRVMLTGTDTIN